MPDFVTRFVSPDVLVGLGVASLVCFVATLIVVPIVLVRLPENYFHETPGWLRGWHPALRIAAYAAKNVLGAVFLLGGLAMLVLPGQGILTMLIGVSLLDVPGKRSLERKLLGRPAVLKAIDAIRRRFGKPPLTPPSRGD
jgi:hypothetical protein